MFCFNSNSMLFGDLLADVFRVCFPALVCFAVLLWIHFSLRGLIHRRRKLCNSVKKYSIAVYARICSMFLSFVEFSHQNQKRRLIQPPLRIFSFPATDGVLDAGQSRRSGSLLTFVLDQAFRHGPVPAHFAEQVVEQGSFSQRTDK